MTKTFIVIGLLGLAGVLAAGFVGRKPMQLPAQPEPISHFAEAIQPSASLSPRPSPTPKPTPKPLTFAEMNEKYGPCISLPVLMYHHVQTEEQAKVRNQTGLSVFTPVFKEQMQHLKDKGYTTITPHDLIEYFNGGVKPASPAVLITVDDGYDDNYTDMFPVLKDFGFKATVFTATGLMENPGYLTWSQIGEMAAAGIYFGNHTWSHKNMQSSSAVIQKEVDTAQIQLAERGLNGDKVFAFPYGTMSGQADAYLTTEGYTLAFDTQPGRILCAKQKFSLPRIRVGNTKLSSYGL